jgi:hypothetical protein
MRIMMHGVCRLQILYACLLIRFLRHGFDRLVSGPALPAPRQRRGGQRGGGSSSEEATPKQATARTMPKPA